MITNFTTDFHQELLEFMKTHTWSNLCGVHICTHQTSAYELMIFTAILLHVLEVGNDSSLTLCNMICMHKWVTDQ